MYPKKKHREEARKNLQFPVQTTMRFISLKMLQQKIKFDEHKKRFKESEKETRRKKNGNSNLNLFFFTEVLTVIHIYCVALRIESDFFCRLYGSLESSSTPKKLIKFYPVS